MNAQAPEYPANRQFQKTYIKCLVWDLDNTLWNGTLLEDDHIYLRPNVTAIIKTLDSRGILHSIASKNDYPTAMQKLQEFGLQDYFLYPQINWNSKASSIKQIARAINIEPNTIAFIDDQPFARDEVHSELPQVLCLDAAELSALLDMPQMNPPYVTQDSQMRRLMYIGNITRNRDEEAFAGPKEAFLASLGMTLTIFPAKKDDLTRAEELTNRTNQLNSPGYTYAYDRLNHFRQSAHHRLLMAKLKDRYGSYGHIGLALLNCTPQVWTIKLLLMSCRVISRGVVSMMLSHIMHQAKQNHVKLHAEFLPTGHNRMMNITYRFAGFEEIEKRGDLVIFEHNLSTIQPFPEYVTVKSVS